MKILVTGYKGFIGSFLYNHLKYECGYNEWVDGLDMPDDIGNFKGPSKNHYDIVIHLAAFAALRDSIENPEKFWKNNVEKSRPIFDYCRENNVRLLYASSAGVYSWWQNPYAVTKKANESMAPPNSVGMRFFNVWAEKESRKDMLYRMLQEDNAKYLTLHKRDWIHVKDVVKAITLLMKSKYTGTIDIGTGKEVGVIELASAMGKHDLPIRKMTPNEPDTLCADTTELEKLGWSSTINIMDYVKDHADPKLE